MSLCHYGQKQLEQTLISLALRQVQFEADTKINNFMRKTNKADTSTSNPIVNTYQKIL